MPPPPEQQAPLASTAFRLDYPTHSTLPQSIKMQWRLSSLSFQIDESAVGGLVTFISTFLELDGVDLLFDEPHLGGKDNLPLSVIHIVHQQTSTNSSNYERIVTFIGYKTNFSFILLLSKLNWHILCF